MKWFAIIMVIILTGLLVLPCADGKGRCEDDDTRTSQTTHRHNQDRDDSCSPFCQCACCGISIASFHFALPELNTPAPLPVAEKNVIRDVYLVSSDLGNIWQPPKFNA